MYVSLKLKLHDMFLIAKALIELRAILKKKIVPWIDSFLIHKMLEESCYKTEKNVRHTRMKNHCH